MPGSYTQALVTPSLRLLPLASGRMAVAREAKEELPHDP
jgi:hypothetical protein